MKIGQLAEAIGCTVETIRFYEQQGMLPPVERGTNNFRCYNTEHLECLSFIRYCRTLDMSLEEIKQLLNLERSAVSPSEEVNALLDRHIKEIAKRIHELDHLRMRLIKLKGEYQQSDQKDGLMQMLLKHQGLKITPLR